MWRVPPAASAVRQLPIRPWPKNAGSTFSVRARSSADGRNVERQPVDSERRVCTTPFGVPVVPDVISIRAGRSRPSARPARALRRTALLVQAGLAAFRRRPDQARACACRRQTRRCSSGVSLGLTATATAPAVHAANTSRMNATPSGWPTTTVSPGPIPLRPVRRRGRRRFAIWHRGNSVCPTALYKLRGLGRPATMAGAGLLAKLRSIELSGCCSG